MLIEYNVEEYYILECDAVYKFTGVSEKTSSSLWLLHAPVGRFLPDYTASYPDDSISYSYRCENHTYNRL
jgi:hypothetical protein